MSCSKNSLGMAVSTALAARLLQLIVNKGVLSQHTISDYLATGRKITSPFTLSAIITQREIQTVLGKSKMLQQDFLTLWDDV